jgi:pyruvate dehydrogenase E2 component (dihydrolipoamide acetyltransferase)
MPGISADAEEAALVEWFVEEGSEISAGAALASVETEKATVDIDSDSDGTIWKLLVEAGDVVTVGAPIAIVVSAGDDTSQEEALMQSLGLGGSAAKAPIEQSAPPAPTTAPEVAPAEAPAPSVAAVAPVNDAVAPIAQPAEAPTAPVSDVAAPDAQSAEAAESLGTPWRRFASPLARKLANDKGIDLATVQGSGPGGRIVRDDVLASPEKVDVAAVAAPALAATVAAPASVAVSHHPGEVVPHSKLRLAVANALGNSKRSSPHFYLTAECRVDALMQLRKDINEHSEVRLSVNDLVIKAVAQAFVEVPAMNVQWRDEGLLTLGSIDISVAIASDKGLVTPVLRGVDQMRVTQVAAQVKEFVAVANAGRLKQADLEGGSFTVTNLGMFGVDEFSAIINPPQVGILAIGAIRQQAVVGPMGALEVGNTMKVTLSADHRPVDGALAAIWLQALKRNLEAPLGMLA